MSKDFEYYKGSLKQFISWVSSTKGILNKCIIADISQELIDHVSALEIELDGNYKHIVDNSAVNHIQKQHGGAKEYLRGQLPVTMDDWEQIPKMLKEYNSLIVSENAIGNSVLIYTFETDNAILHYVEEIRKGRKELATCSLYNTKKETHRR